MLQTAENHQLHYFRSCVIFFLSLLTSPGIFASLNSGSRSVAIDLSTNWETEKGETISRDRFLSMLNPYRKEMVSGWLKQAVTGPKDTHLFLYVRSSVKGFSFRIAGKTIPFQKLSPTEILYDLSGQAGPMTIQFRMRKREIIVPKVYPAIFLVNRSGLRRIQTAEVSISTPRIHNGELVSLKGPIWMQILTESEKEKLRENPMAFQTNPNRRWIVPLIGDYTELTGPFPDNSTSLYTFSLRFSSPPQRTLAFSLGGTKSEVEAYFNGRLLSRNTKQTSRIGGQQKVFSVPNSWILSENNRLLLLVSEKNQPGFLTEGRPLIAESGALFQDLAQYEVLILSIAGIYMLIGIYFFYIYIRLKDAPDNLFLALFSWITSGLLLIKSGIALPWLGDPAALKKWESSLLFLCIPVFLLYLHHFYRRRKSISEFILRELFYLYLPPAVLFAGIPLAFYNEGLIRELLSIFHKSLLFIAAPYAAFIFLRELLEWGIRQSKGKVSVIETIDAVFRVARKPVFFLIKLLPQRTQNYLEIESLSLRDAARKSERTILFPLSGLLLLVLSGGYRLFLMPDSLSGLSFDSAGILAFILLLAWGQTSRFVLQHTEYRKLKEDLSESIAHKDKMLETAIGALKKNNANFEQISIHTMKGQQLLLKQDIKASIGEFQKALLLSGENAPLHHVLGKCYLKTGDFEKAAHHLEIYLSKAKGDHRLWYHLSAAHYNQGDYDRALESADKSLQLKPDFVNALLVKALCLKQIESAESAEEIWKQIIELQPNHPLAQKELRLLHS